MWIILHFGSKNNTTMHFCWRTEILLADVDWTIYPHIIHSFHYVHFMVYVRCFFSYTFTCAMRGICARVETGLTTTHPKKHSFDHRLRNSLCMSCPFGSYERQFGQRFFSFSFKKLSMNYWLVCWSLTPIYHIIPCVLYTDTRIVKHLTSFHTHYTHIQTTTWFIYCCFFFFNLNFRIKIHTTQTHKTHKEHSHTEIKSNQINQ